MTSVDEAKRIVLENKADLGNEIVLFTDATGRILAENIKADRDIPHFNGGQADIKQGDILAVPGQLITPVILSIITSVGEEEIRVKKLPRVVVISTGEELVEVREVPNANQSRRTNCYTAQAILKNNGIQADILHVPADADVMERQLAHCLQHYDAIIIAGKSDVLIAALDKLYVKEIFNKVAQHPGDDFWFGKHENGVPLFAFHGSVTAIMVGVHCYFLPWLRATLNMPEQDQLYAILSDDVDVESGFSTFLQVKLSTNSNAQLIAQPLTAKNYAEANALLQLPASKSQYKKGEMYNAITVNYYNPYN
ncbi:MAG: hypothetical protein EOP46_00630 [Sphingobacteriaceae bacterium]|nr:MAG: hypothetical protein EOP46_00630 [Sphingobacteriaceae bacterium]